MFGGQKKPFTAVSVHIDRLTSEQYEDGDLSGIVDLVEVIRIQASGPTEAARALRKKLKYGSPHAQMRALTVLDGLIQNAGSRFQRTFADEPLLERLRATSTDFIVDSEVKQRCNQLIREWHIQYRNKPGLERIAALYKQVPQKKEMNPNQSRVVRETEREAQLEDPTSPASSSSTTGRRSSQSATSPQQSYSFSSQPFSHAGFGRKSKSKRKPFNLEKERPALLEAIASASISSTNLTNALKLVNRENARVSETPEIVNHFEKCKGLRRQILRYIQLVESDQFLGSLLSANDELVKALMAFEIMDKSIDDDSDSDTGDMDDGFAGLNVDDRPPNKPPRPGNVPMPPVTSERSAFADDSAGEDEDNPFSDNNAVTPFAEKSEPTW